MRRVWRGDAAVKATGVQLHWRWRCRLRQSTVVGGGATSSPSTYVAASSGTPPTRVAPVSLAGAVCRCRYVPGGHAPCPRRRGGRVVAHLASASSLRAPVAATRLSSTALDRCFAHSSMTWTWFAVKDLARLYERALRGSAHLPDRTRSLRAMDRRLCALSRRARAQRRCDHRDEHHDGHAQSRGAPRMHSSVTPKIKSCLTEFQPAPAHTSHCINSPAHAGMF